MKPHTVLALAAVLLACDSSEPDEFRTGLLGDEVDVVTNFSKAAGETPEGIAATLDGALYTSLALTGEIRRVEFDGSQTSHAFIPLGDPAACSGPFPPLIGGIATDIFGNLYVGASSCGEIEKGVWRVGPDGDASQIATVPATSFLNGIAVHAGRVYISDSASTKIWRTEIYASGGPADVWTDEPLLADPDPFNLDPGANGLQFFGNSVFVANSDAATIVRIPFHLGGPFGGNFIAQAGELYVGPLGSGAHHEVDEALFPGCDDFAFDIIGRIYCTTDPYQTLVRIDHDGDVTILLDGEDGLDGPTAAVFGRKGNRETLYVSNASFPFFPSTGFGPSILSLDLGIPGYPLR